ncbi:hypothetical protein NS228_01920 [Methylobacterium indicum]|uniref:hypothetical protein n=1 Tax=Methylobacterium indicum TaxID=1775910 RepID=UPI000734DF99|nr:hypothetical protein [Methylobacterium indicum]KTS23841.1 hypothetical protein NS229_22285 [Methylobacterium indicum]KTS42573.1 hypothetical protein NS228_01920 [Methylobacterium indicum]KTS50299.1 hypothetical protein NS230_16355 [Methylobacterium indicum]
MTATLKPQQYLADLLSLAAARAGVPTTRTPTAMTAAAAPPAAMPAPPTAAVRWLAELMLLYGLPFEYLVPVAGMLPPESIRFFFLDQNWTNRLIDGAASVGVASTVDELSTYAALEPLVRQAALAAPSVRARLLKRDTAPAAAPAGPITGFLLRSAVVSGWPGLEVAATDAAGNSLVPPLRFERLAPDILLCLLNGLPVEVVVKQPTETMHFGVVEASGGTYQVTLRHVGGAEAGTQIGTQQCPTVQRGGNAPGSVINVQQTAAALLAALVSDKALPDGTAAISSAQLAIQMVQSAGLQPFQPQQSPPAAASAPAAKSSG